MAMRALVCLRRTIPAVVNRQLLTSMAMTTKIDQFPDPGVSRLIIDVNDPKTKVMCFSGTSPEVISCTWPGGAGGMRNVEGYDFEHWKVFTKPLPGSPPKDLIVRYYVQTLAQLLGSQEEAVKKIYSVATRYYYAFGALISNEQGDKLQSLPNVCCVIPDQYVDAKGKGNRYPWDPFVNGQALSVPYDRIYYPLSPSESLTDEELGKTHSRHNFPAGRYANPMD